MNVPKLSFSFSLLVSWLRECNYARADETGGLNLFTDILLIILPVPVLLNVRLTWQKYVLSSS